MPIVPKDCCEFVIENGLGTAGVFRLAPAKSALLEAKRQYDLGIKVNLIELGGIHVACGLLKLWLRELPQPLFPESQYHLLKYGGQNLNPQTEKGTPNT